MTRPDGSIGSQVCREDEKINRGSDGNLSKSLETTEKQGEAFYKEEGKERFWKTEELESLLGGSGCTREGSRVSDRPPQGIWGKSAANFWNGIEGNELNWTKEEIGRVLEGNGCIQEMPRDSDRPLEGISRK